MITPSNFSSIILKISYRTLKSHPILNMRSNVTVAPNTFMKIGIKTHSKITL